jgi:glycosyltransferase involved in cell wall biosynthesis
MKQATTFFSIVIPTYNRANLIVKTIASLQHQNYDHYEMIIVDDGSTDNTADVVQPFLGYKIRYVKKENSERGASRNFGAKLAQGDYVNFFDSDDIALPNHLSEAARLIASHNRPEWFHLGYAWVTDEERVFKTVNGFKGATLNGIMCSGNHLSCNGVFVRKDIILANPFNEDRDLSASEDYELWLRLSSRYPLFYSNEITSWIVNHDSRSVKQINIDKLKKRINLLLHCLQQDEQVMRFYKKDFNKIKTDLISYIALHLTEEKKYKTESINYLLRSIKTSSTFIFKKRFVAILKNLLIKW